MPYKMVKKDPIIPRATFGTGFFCYENNKFLLEK